MHPEEPGYPATGRHTRVTSHVEHSLGTRLLGIGEHEALFEMGTGWDNLSK
jgi:hypothetical protein